MSTTSKSTRLLKALAEGERVTKSAARKRFRIPNLSATVSYLRTLGYDVENVRTSRASYYTLQGFRG